MGLAIIFRLWRVLKDCKENIVHMKQLLFDMLIVCVLSLCGCQRAHAAEGDVFVFVDDESLLQSDDEVIILNRDASMAMSSYAVATYLKACMVQPGDDGKTVAALSDSLCIMKLQKSSGGWTLRDVDGRLLVVRDGSSELLELSAKTQNRMCVAKLEFAANGDCLMSFGKQHYVKFRGDDRFGSYPNRNSVHPIQIYRKLRTNAVVGEMSLGEAGGNESLLAGNADMRVRTLTVGRTFVADGGFYTICLPVEVCEREVDDVFGGAEFYEFKSVESNGDGNSVLFHFARVQSLEAGKPYIMKPVADVVAPQLHDKLLLATVPLQTQCSLNGWKYAFVGTFDPVALSANGRTRFLGSSGLVLSTPNRDGSLQGLRGYFLLPDALPSVGFDVPQSGAKYSIALDGDCNVDGETACISVPAGSVADNMLGNAVYNVCGQRMSVAADRLPKGLYIVGGRKIIVR